MINLRPVEEKDTLFIEFVYRSTREAELTMTNWTEQKKDAFIIMQSMAQLAEYKMKFPGAEYQIIIYNKKDAGRFYTCETEDEIRIMDITILPPYRGKKIGTQLLERVIERSNMSKKKLSLHVLQNNPAIRLYQRLGFEMIRNTATHLYMERKPGGLNKMGN